MKKISILLMGSLLFSIVCFSQATTIKPAVGMTVTDFSKVDNGEAKGKVGYQVGGSIAFGKKIYVEPGVFYCAKSTEFSYSNVSNQTLDANIRGIRVPVAVGVNLLGNEKTTVGLRVFGGGSGFFVTSVGSDINKDYVEKTNWGVFAGAGVDFWKLFLDASYEWSLTNLQKDISQVQVGKSRSLFVNAGLRINL